MAYYRLQIDLPIPLSGTDSDSLSSRLPKQLLEKPTSAQLAAMGNMTWLDILRFLVKRLNSYSSKIISAENIEEPGSNKAVAHICRHDMGLPCDPEENL